MKRIFTDEQIVGILRGFEASGQTIKQYCRQNDVSKGTFYKWRSRYGTITNIFLHGTETITEISVSVLPIPAGITIVSVSFVTL
jgi:transposase-like protein